MNHHRREEESCFDDSRIYHALESVQRTREGLDQGTLDVNSWGQHSGQTLLQLACNYYSSPSRNNVVRLLLERGADVNARSRQSTRQTALHLVLQPRHGSRAAPGVLRLIEILLEFGVNVNTPNGKGSLPLHYACLFFRGRNHSFHKAPAIVRRLLQAPNGRRAITKINREGDNPLHYACLNSTRKVSVSTALLEIMWELAPDEVVEAMLHPSQATCYTDQVTPLYCICLQSGGRGDLFELLMQVLLRLEEHNKNPKGEKDSIQVSWRDIFDQAVRKGENSGPLLKLWKRISGHLTPVEKDRYQSILAGYLRTPTINAELLDEDLLLSLDMNHETEKGETPLLWAVLPRSSFHCTTGKCRHASQVMAVRRLLKAGADPNKVGLFAFICGRPHEPTTPLCCALNPRNYAYSKRSCCQKVQAEIVDLLVEYGAVSPTPREVERILRGSSPPYSDACYMLDEGVLQVLVEKGWVNWTSGVGQMLLHRILDRKSTAKPNLHDPRLLPLQTKIVGHLVRGGAPVNVTDALGVYPLYKACLYFGESMVRILVGHGANVDQGNDDHVGETPLLLLCSRYTQQVKGTLDCLLDAGAKVTASDKFRRTPIHVACQKADDLALVHILVQRFQSTSNSTNCINVADTRGYTPLMLISFCRPHVTRALLAYGADPNHMAEDGETPLSRAIHYSHTDCSKSNDGVRASIELLLEHGAEWGVDDAGADERRKSAMLATLGGFGGSGDGRHAARVEFLFALLRDHVLLSKLWRTT